MHHFAKMILSAGLTALALLPAAVPARANPSHQAHAVADAINPYICDVDGDLSDHDFTSALVNDNGHLVLRVKSFTDTETSYFCDNAGGFAPLSHPMSFQTISAWAKTNGDFTPSDVYVELHVSGTVYYFNTTNATVGPTENGYTLYTWKANDLVGNMGLPANPVISKFGFSINVYTIGSGSITGITLNDHHVGFGAHTVVTCPFSKPQQCVE